jgi:hypothetical protein
MTSPPLSVPTANGRYYAHPSDRRMVPSITNIIDTLSKPALKFWAAREAANYAADNREKLAGLKRDEAFTLVRNAPFARTDDSPSAIGDIVHGWIERHVKGDSPSHDEIYASHHTARDMYLHFVKFRDTYSPEFTDAEFTVWSDKHGYAGTADISMRINGVHVLADTKTGQNVYPETAMQLAALARADVVLTVDGAEHPVPPYERFAILHLRPRSATLVPVDNIDAAFETFLALKKAFDWKAEYADRTLGFAPKIN